MKSILFHGMLSGIVASIVGIIYLEIYQNMLMTDFKSIINAGSIIGSSIIGCLAMSIGYLLLFKINKLKFRGILNILICVLTFMTIIGPLGMNLPFEIEFPELFPGLVIPMHFFPAMVFFALDPFFSKK